MTRQEFLRMLQKGAMTDVRIDREARTAEGTFPPKRYKVVVNGQSYRRKSEGCTVRVLDLDDDWLDQYEAV